jgi:hypothetical protein
MAWEQRGKNSLYFYLNRRLPDGRIQKQYYGCGIKAELESIRLEKKAEIRRQLHAERQLTAVGDSLLQQHVLSTTDVVHGLMLMAGYNNERSRGWRPLKMIAPQESTNVPLSTEPAQAEASFSELVKAARQGDRSVIPALRRMMQENPDLAANNGDLAAKTAIHWVDLIAGKDLYYRECLLMRVAELRAQLTAETNGTIVEAMVVEQCVSTWLQLYHHENREATRPAESIQLGEFRLKKIESAFKRYMKSLGALSALKAVRFDRRMRECLAPPANRTGSEQRALLDGPTNLLEKNRLSDSFEQMFEPAPVN